MKAALSRAALVPMCFASSPVVQAAAEGSGAILFSGQTACGTYSNSVERSGYIREMFAVTYQKPDNYSANLILKDLSLYWKPSPGSVHAVEPGIGLTGWIPLSPKELMGIQ